MLSLKMQNIGDATIIRCAGRVTFPDADALQTIVFQQARARTVMIDLAEVTVIDASGLGILISLRGWAQKTGVKLKLMHLNPRIERLLELTNLKSKFDICSTPEMLDLLGCAIHEGESVRFELSIQDPGARTRPQGLNRCSVVRTRVASLALRALLQNVVSSTFVRMPAIHSTPELFEIEAASPETCDPQDEGYIIRIRLEGTYEVRAFLSDNRVDEKRIAFAIEELGRTGRANVSNQPQKRTA